MERFFARSLDRPVDIFGLKGAWIIVLLVCCGVSLFLGLIVGFFTSAGYGITTVLLLVILSVIGCFMGQSNLNHRELMKFPMSKKMDFQVIRRQTLCSCLLKDKAAANSWFCMDHKDEILENKKIR